MVGDRWVATLVSLVLMALGWLLIGPSELGGPVSLVSTYGDSMQPTYGPSDLVVVRATDDVGVGDAVAYRSDDLDTVVLHRIVDHDDDSDGFVLSGDNNDWLDTDRPTTGDIIGTAWFSIPGAGRFLDLPTGARIGMALGAIALVGALFASRSGKRRRRTPRPPARSDQPMSPLDTPPAWARPAAQAGAVALVLAAALALMAFTRPASEAGPVDYTHRGEFTYHADAPAGPAYPDGEVTTGEIVYRSLVDEIDVAFAYRFAAAADADADVTGEVELLAEVADGNGWRDTISLGADAPIEGAHATVEATLDLDELDDRVDAFQEEAGVSGGSRTVTLAPQVAVEGSLAGEELSDRFAPTLELRLGEAEVRPEQGTGGGSDDAHDADDDAADGEPDAGSPAITVTETGEVSAPGQQPATMQLLGRELEVGTARWASVIGGGFALLVTAVAGALLARTPRDDPYARALARHGRWIVPVARVDLPPGRTVVDVGELEALIRMAVQHEGLIMCWQNDGEPVYLLEHDGTVYRHHPGGPPPQPQRDDVVPPPPPAVTAAR